MIRYWQRRQRERAALADWKSSYGYQSSVTNQPLSTLAHIAQQVKFNVKTSILTICPSTFTCNIVANMRPEVCTVPMLIQIFRVVTLSGRDADW